MRRGLHKFGNARFAPFVLFADIKTPTQIPEIRVSQVARDLAQGEEEIRAPSAHACARTHFFHLGSRINLRNSASTCLPSAPKRIPHC